MVPSFTCSTSMLHVKSYGASYFTLVVKSVTTRHKNLTNYVTSLRLKASTTWLCLPALCTHTKLKSAKNSYHRVFLAVSFFWVEKNVLATLSITTMNLIPIKQCFQVSKRWMTIVISFSCVEYLCSTISSFWLSNAVGCLSYTNTPPKALFEAFVCISKGSSRSDNLNIGSKVITSLSLWKAICTPVPISIPSLSSTIQWEEELSWSKLQ